jgi:hypothetical protein
MTDAAGFNAGAVRIEVQDIGAAVRKLEPLGIDCIDHDAGAVGHDGHTPLHVKHAAPC